LHFTSTKNRKEKERKKERKKKRKEQKRKEEKLREGFLNEKKRGGKNIESGNAIIQKWKYFREPSQPFFGRL
jgi:hypothetical protein